MSLSLLSNNEILKSLQYIKETLRLDPDNDCAKIYFKNIKILVKLNETIDEYYKNEKYSEILLIFDEIYLILFSFTKFSNNLK